MGQHFDEIFNIFLVVCPKNSLLSILRFECLDILLFTLILKLSNQLQSELFVEGLDDLYKFAFKVLFYVIQYHFQALLILI
jgi:hypothetical protein